MEKLIFHDPVLSPVSDSEMNAISFALYKEATRPLDDDEFFEIAQFYVRGIKDDVDEEALVSFCSYPWIFFNDIIYTFSDTMFMLF